MNTCKGENLFKIFNVTDFDLTHIFECGQCFRWDKTDDGSYTGVAHGRVINLSYAENTLTIKNTSKEDFNAIWKHYFDFERDYSEIKKILSKDVVLKNAIDFGGGIRILNQDLWECIISFIISANNNIKRIKGIVKRFCECFGKPVSYNGEIFYTFPSPNDLQGVTIDDLTPLKAGFRNKYIIDAINKVNSGEVNLNNICNLSTNDARNELLKIKGIGRKVADCILLFGAGRGEVFPVDVWVKRVMAELYTIETEKNNIFDFAEKNFGQYAGIAQQYLFYYMREQGGKKDGGKENV